jgi:hypothetical protein
LPVSNFQNAGSNISASSTSFEVPTLLSSGAFVEKERAGFVGFIYPLS